MKIGDVGNIFFIFVFGIIILSFVSAAFDAIIDDEINKQFSSGKDSVKVIVRLKDNTVVRSGARSLSMMSTSVTEDKFATASEILGSENIVHKFEYSNSFSAKLTQEEIKELKNSGAIESISYDYPVHAMLDVSVPLINADDAWNVNVGGINLTGVGQTVCVIDTGVDFTHPSLAGKNLTCNIDCYDKSCVENCSVLDDNGHGTHVAGIVASQDSTYRGVAPGANLIGVKVLDLDGNGWSSDVIDGIWWCVDNASEYNISVISMSLGSGLYVNYCDEDYLDMSNAINNATAKNISVVIAAGNGLNNVGPGNYTAISTPACIQSAIPISSVTKSNIIDNDYADRNFMVQLLAPGTNIFSANASNTNFFSGTGTSMATPHVSGAIAIINQYLKSVNKLKTPFEIESILNSTGVLVQDVGSSGLNFSRIDVYSALMYLDETRPEVNLISPDNDTINISRNQTFYFNGSDWQLKNATIYIWNSSSLWNFSFKNFTGTDNSSEFLFEEIPFGEYEWNVLVYDMNNNSAFAQENFSLLIGGAYVEIIEPDNESYTNQNETNFSCYAISDNNFVLTNMTFYLWNGSYWENKTEVLTGIENFSITNFTLGEETDYIWYCEAFNNDSESYRSENYSLFYDAVYPNISEVANYVDYSSVTLIWNTSEETNYTLSLQGKYNSSFFRNYSVLVTGLSASTTYGYNITYCDIAGNCNVTYGNFTTSSAPVIRTSSGGGGGGGSTKTNTSVLGSAIKNNPKNIIVDSLNGSNFSMNLNDSVILFFGNRLLNLVINEIFEDAIIFNFSNKEFKVNFSEQFLLGILENGYENMTIGFEKINETEVYVLLKNQINVAVEKNETSIEQAFNLLKDKNSYWKEILIVVIVCAMVLIRLIILRRMKTKKWRR